MDKLAPFHLAIPVNNLASTRSFYRGILGCEEGRSAESWVDFNFFGHQLVCHLDDKVNRKSEAIHTPVDGHVVPVPHFGIVLDMKAWKQVAELLKQSSVKFIIEPYVRFQGEPGEQATMFLHDPSGNALEFKAFKNRDRQLFAK